MYLISFSYLVLREIWLHVVWYKFKDISEERTAFISRVKKQPIKQPANRATLMTEVNKFFRNVAEFLTDYKASNPVRKDIWTEGMKYRYASLCVELR